MSLASFVGNLCVLIGVSTAGVLGWALLRRTRAPKTWVLLTPALLVALGAWMSSGVDAVWLAVITGFAVLFPLFARQVLAVVHRARGDQDIEPTALAVVMLVGVLLEVGLLLTVRLVVVPDPADGLGAGLQPSAWRAARWSLLLPAGVPLLVLAGWRAVLAIRRRRDEPRTFPRAVRIVLLGVLLVLLAGASIGPALPGTGASNLQVGPIATPEFARIPFLVLLAVGVVAYAPLAVARAGWQHVVGGRRRARPAELPFVLVPGVLLGIVAVGGVLRSDFGVVIPALAGAVGATWAGVRYEASRAVAADPRRSAASRDRGRGTALRYYRPLLWVGSVLTVIAFVVAARTGYITERGSIWRDPWRFRWSAGCDPVVAGPGVPAPPSGAVVCQRFGAADLESERSQVARALSAISDGGLWGRGLREPLSPRLPAASTDFVLAAAWSKLGGLCVVALLLAVIVLAIALIRLTGRLSAGHERTADRAVPLSQAFGCGLAVMIAGQFGFAFAATVNLLPHSGVTVPLLSRGPQATLALLGAIALAFVLAYRADGTVVPAPRRTEPRVAYAWGSIGTLGGRPAGRAGGRAPSPAPTLVARPSQGLVLLVFAGCLAGAVSVTLLPYLAPAPLRTLLPTGYAEDRAPCRGEVQLAGKDDRDGPTAVSPDPANCSTDQVAYNRTRVTIDLSDGTAFRQERPGDTWVACGSDVSVADLAGLIAQPGGGLGDLDTAFRQDLYGTAGTSLADRMLPPTLVGGQPDGELRLTLEPTWQHQAAALVAGREPTGLVVIDGSSGAVIAAASNDRSPAVPSAADGVSGCTESAMEQRRRREAEATSKFLSSTETWQEENGPGHRGPDGTIVPDQATCGSGVRDEAQRRRCTQWSLTPADAVGSSDTPENSGALSAFGLGSTFKTVVAMAYLRAGGSLENRVPAPSQAHVPGRPPVNNATEGLCPRTDRATETITVADALAVSCNTAFVRLVLDGRLDWDDVTSTAALLGFRIGTPPSDGVRIGLVNADRSIGADSWVPAEPDPVRVADSVIGEGDVMGTPLQMAAVMSVLANNGRLNRPVLVESARNPRTHEDRRTLWRESVTILTESQNEALRRALATTDEEGGTAHGLKRVGDDVALKTGTHERAGADCEIPSRSCSVPVASWFAGTFCTAHGRVAFALAVNTDSEKSGGERSRAIVQRMLDTWGGKCPE